MISHEHARTLSIVGELAQGKHLTIPDVGTIGMGEDMSIGFVMCNPDSKEFIGGWTTMNLRQLNQLLTEHDIGMVIAER